MLESSGCLQHNAGSNCSGGIDRLTDTLRMMIDRVFA